MVGTLKLERTGKNCGCQVLAFVYPCIALKLLYSCSKAYNKPIHVFNHRRGRGLWDGNIWKFVICLNSCPRIWTINCPVAGFFPCFIATEQHKRILRFDAYRCCWSSLGTIKCPLVQPGSSEGRITKNAALFWTYGISYASKRTLYGKKHIYEAWLFYFELHWR